MKGVRFRNHRTVGDILELAERYCKAGADELVFYDITASPDGRSVDRRWITSVAALLDIPFCVAGGIRSVADATDVLNKGADKISINSPALARPDLIDELARRFGTQCVVLGVDSLQTDESYVVYQNTGDPDKARSAARTTVEWINEAQRRGVGEIVLNCMNQDGVREGYDIDQLSMVRDACDVPLIASGGAGSMAHFLSVFQDTNVDGALAAGVFHDGEIAINHLKHYLARSNIEVRI